MTINFANKLKSFESKIYYFNGLYKLPLASYPCIKVETDYQATRLQDTDPLQDGRELLVRRLTAFKDILSEECTEINDVIKDVEDQDSTNGEIEFLTNMADLLGDVVVYCRSEAARYGIPLEEVLSIIMDSNFSKLGEDGKPIYDERGKVMKGPNYWKPEPKIKELLLERIKEST